MSRGRRLPLRGALLGLLALVPTVARIQAQDPATVEALAPILQAEDSRRWAPQVYRTGLENPDPLVRRTAAMAIGRVGDLRGTPLLVEFLPDPDTTLQTSVVFALGLLRDTTAVAPIIARFSAEPRIARETALEAITALARIGGRSAAEFLSSILRRTVRLTVDSTVPLRQAIAQEAWRLGRLAPAADLVPLLRDTVIQVRRGAVYTLGRLRYREAAEGLQLALRDPDPQVRSWAARALTRTYADSAGVASAGMVAALERLLSDEDKGVRISAMRALGTYRDSTLSGVIVPLLKDPDFNVRVQAATTLGQLGGPEASKALRETLDSRDPFGVRREALLALARVDSAGFLAAVEPWLRSSRWDDRMAAAQAWTQSRAPLPARSTILAERDPRVLAAWLQTWSTVEEVPSAELLAAARTAITHSDGAVRSVAADILARAADPSDIPALRLAYSRSERDSFPEAAWSALAALDTIAATSASAAERVDREFLSLSSRPSSYLIRAWARDNWPAAYARWGDAYPIETGRTLQDYRELARRFLVGPDSVRYPRVQLLTEQRGTIELELFGPDAPITVANFLALVDRHFFDGNTWHRVVPDFVVQDGDRRGDGWGGPGGPPIRDEINRRRYGTATLGMALSGPDTGGSQWFITLSPQPHLDGIYTIFGRVVSGHGALYRVTQGDRITSIRR